MRKEKFGLEAFLIMVVHFLGVGLLFWLVIIPPIRFSIIGLIIEEAQMKYFGRCFLTVYAHKRGYMKGKTFFQYVPYLLGDKNYKRTDKIVSLLITAALLVILSWRILRQFI